MMKVIKSKLNKRIALVLLASGIALGGLTGCSNSEKTVDASKYEFVLDNLSNMDDTKIQDYVNKIPFSDLSFRESTYNTIENLSYKDYVLEHNFYELSSLDLINVSNFKDLELFPNINLLTLDDCSVNDYGNFNNRNIGVLTLKNMDIDCSKLVNLDIKNITFDHCNLTNQEELQKLNLDSICVSYTKLDNIDFLNGMSHLKSVELDNTNVGDYSSLANLKLDRLTISLCQVNDFDFLKDMKSLKNLNLSYTNFCDASVLSGLKKLTDLDISYTFVDDISSLKELNKLENLNIDSCKKVDDYSDIGSLGADSINKTNLEMDYNNDISDKIKKIYNSIGITDDMSDEEKVRMISIAVLKIMKYDYNNVNGTSYYNDNELKSASDGLGICSSYSGLTTALLDLAGINNYSLQGECVLDDSSMLHRWNIVEIDGKWVGLDTTFLDDDSVNGEEKLEDGKDSIYYLDDLNSAEWEKYHYPYAMPDIGRTYDYNLAR